MAAHSLYFRLIVDGKQQEVERHGVTASTGSIAAAFRHDVVTAALEAIESLGYVAPKDFLHVGACPCCGRNGWK